MTNRTATEHAALLAVLAPQMFELLKYFVNSHDRHGLQLPEKMAEAQHLIAKVERKRHRIAVTIKPGYGGAEIMS
jgi:hypothetical protein